MRALVDLVPRVLRRSMRLRVVGLTLLLGALVVWAAGALVLNDVATGLVENRRTEVLTESAGALEEVQDAFAAPDIDDRAGVEAALWGVLQRIEATPGRPGVLLLRAPTNDSSIVLSSPNSDSLESFAVPAELRAAVASADGVQQSQVVSAPTAGGGTGPAIVVGGVVELAPAGPHELYLVYAMDDQVAALSLVERAFTAGGVVLVLLVATIAWLVARLVVTPVGVAARTAEQLAAGELDRRMAVHGEDELARLATSFNTMAASLQAQITRLESLSRLQQRFVSDVSHELRTPLTTIRMAADVLQDRLGDGVAADADTRRSAELLGNQIERFERLLADLLEVSRFDAGAAQLELAEVDVAGLVRDAVELTAPAAAGTGIRLGLTVTVHDADGPGATAPPADTGADVAVSARVDPRRVSRVVRNLLSNAIEHAEGRDVQIRVVAGPEAVAVGVRDHGPGLSAADQERVFDRFWRADPSRRRTLGGTGLGLAISVEDARLHAGRLEVWSRPGQGAHFVLTVPRRGGELPSVRPLALEPPDAPVRVASAPLDPAVAT